MGDIYITKEEENLSASELAKKYGYEGVTLTYTKQFIKE